MTYEREKNGSGGRLGRLRRVGRRVDPAGTTRATTRSATLDREKEGGNDVVGTRHDGGREGRASADRQRDQRRTTKSAAHDHTMASGRDRRKTRRSATDVPCQE